MPSIAFSLGKLVARLPRDARVHVVGHSLGGVVARYYVQELGGHARVTQTIALAAPFGGAPIAARIPLFVGRDLHRRASSSCASARAPPTWRAAPFDRGDRGWHAPHDHADALPWGDRISLEGRGHNTLLFDDQVGADCRRAGSASRAEPADQATVSRRDASSSASGGRLRLDEDIERDAERVGDLHRDEERRAELAALESRDVVARQARRLGELDLRPTLLLARDADALADVGCEVVRIDLAHPPRVRLEPLPGLCCHHAKDSRWSVGR